MKMFFRLRGFSLVELMVVCAIIGVLAALLLPAVQHTREAANYLQCKVQLQQIGVALHVYHDQCGVLPPSYSPIPSYLSFSESLRQYHAREYVTMFWYLLPLMEGDESDSERLNGLTSLVCPSRRSVSAQPRTDYGLFDFEYDLWGWWNGSQTRRYWTPILHAGPTYPDEHYYEIPQLDCIPDGASTTILLAHKGLDPEFYHNPCEFPTDSIFAPQNGDPRSYALWSDRGWSWAQCPEAWTTWPGLDIARFPHIFYKDKSGGHYNGVWNSMFFLNTTPCFWLMTSPHASMPLLFADGSVRTMGFTNNRTYNLLFTPTGFGYSTSKEVKLNSYLWLKNDGQASAVDLTQW